MDLLSQKWSHMKDMLFLQLGSINEPQNEVFLHDSTLSLRQVFIGIKNKEWGAGSFSDKNCPLSAVNGCIYRKSFMFMEKCSNESRADLEMEKELSKMCFALT